MGRANARLAQVTLASAVVLAGCHTRTAPAGRIALTPCHLTGSSAQVVDALCGTFQVPEDRSAPPSSGQRMLGLAVSVVNASGRSTAPDAIFILAGGPGQSARDVYPDLAPAFVDLNLDHDIVLVDQRGTGHSAPLSCPDIETETTTSDPDEQAKLARACRDALSQHADLSQYTTTIAMDDLDDVRQALGYETVDLYGASYGTRAALVYLRRHEAHVRTVVVDGVAPPGWTLGMTAGKDAQRAMDLIFAHCAAEKACGDAFPDLKGALGALLAAHETPETVVVPHPTTAAPTPVVVSRETLGSTLHILSYESETATLLPLLVHSAAATSDLHPLAAQSLLVSGALKLSFGEHLAVVCSEDAPFFDLAQAAADGAGTYLGDSAPRRYAEACAGWPRADVSPADRAPVTSSVPVLLLSGEFDPATPPDNAALAAKTLPNSVTLTVPGEGHGALLRSCTPRIVRDFVKSGSVAKVSGDCLQRSEPLRFFTTFAGPPP